MDNIPSPSEETMLVALASLYSNTLKDSVVCLGGKLGDLPNKRRSTVVTDIILHLNV